MIMGRGIVVLKMVRGGHAGGGPGADGTRIAAMHGAGEGGARRRRALGRGPFVALTLLCTSAAPTAAAGAPPRSHAATLACVPER